MTSQPINVGKDFYYRLANRSHLQGDGKFNAIQFRRIYLHDYDNQVIWSKDNIPTIIFDFSEVKKIGPGFANEAFGYFTKYATPEKILSVFLFINITNVKKEIIKEAII